MHQRAGNIIKQARPVIAIHLYHGMRLAHLVGYNDPRGQLHRLHPARQCLGFLPQPVGQQEPASQGFLDQLLQPAQLRRVCRGLQLAVLQAEHIQYRAILAGIDTGRHNRTARHRHRPGYAAEQAGVILGNNGQNRRPAGRIGPQIKAQGLAGLFKLGKQAGMGEQLFGLKTGPVRGVERLHPAIDLPALPALFRRQFFCCSLHCLGRGLCCDLRRGGPAQHRGCPVKQGAHQAGLPAIPDPGPDPANIGHCQNQQQLQPLRRLHLFGKFSDGLRIIQIIAKGGLGKQQMPAHQPDNRFGFFLIQPKERAQAARHPGPQL